MSRQANECLGTKKLSELFYHPRKSYRVAARVFETQSTWSTQELANAMGMSKASATACLRDFRQANLIYICHWQRSHEFPAVWHPVYRVGNQPDVPKPSGKLPKTEEAKPSASPPPSTIPHWQALATALVPRRTGEELHHINRLYLNWISEGMYG